MSAEHFKKLLREAEKRVEQAEKEQQKERQRADIAEEQTRLTTLDEYIAACHSLVYSQFVIETDPTLTSQSSITNPRGKWCPQSLQPWSEILEIQRINFGSVYDTFPTEERVFENRNFLAGLGNRVSQRPIQDEKSLETFLHISVEDPVRAIIERLKMVQDARATVELGDDVIFENHPHALSEVADEVADSETPATTSTPPRTPDYGRDLNKLRPDQICVYRSDDSLLSRRTMIYISEYKPPHKLTAPHLRVGLRAMDIYKEVVNRKYHAERLTASAITQTYHYMIQSGLEYLSLKSRMVYFPAAINIITNLDTNSVERLRCECPCAPPHPVKIRKKYGAMRPIGSIKSSTVRLYQFDLRFVNYSLRLLCGCFATQRIT